jgi:hypothetical protein
MSGDHYDEGKGIQRFKEVDSAIDEKRELQFSPDPVRPVKREPQEHNEYYKKTKRHHKRSSRNDHKNGKWQPADETGTSDSHHHGNVAMAEHPDDLESTGETQHQSSDNANAEERAGAFRVSGPGSVSSTSFDADNTVAATDSTTPRMTDEYLAVAETVTETPLVTGVPSPGDEAIYQTALKAAREGAADERRASHRKLIMLAVVFLIIIVVAVIVSVLLVPKQSSNTTEINQKVNIFNTAYETQYTTQIILARGGLTGTLPTELFLLSDLTLLDLSDNALTGTLPSDLANLPKLAQIDISDNKLTGWIPTEYGKMTQMTELSLYGNEGLSGPIPSELAHLNDLSILWLYETNLSGSISASLCTLDTSIDLRIDCGEIACDCCTSSDLITCNDSTLPQTLIPSQVSTPTTTPVTTPPSTKPAINPVTESLMLDKEEYVQGQSIQATLSDPSQVEISDDVLLFNSDVTDYTNTPAIKSVAFGLGAGDYDATGVTTLRVDFVETGTFKLIVRAFDSDLIIAESIPFSIIVSSATLTLDKEEYTQGQSIQATLSDPTQVEISDDVLLFNSDATDYTNTPAIKSVAFGLGAEDYDATGVTTLRVDFVETGTFKLIVRAFDSDLIIAESIPFSIIVSSATLTLDKEAYTQGQSIQATLSDPSQVEISDDVLLFNSNVTDYTNTPAIKSVAFGLGAGDYDATGVTTLRVDFVETGTLKLIVRAYNSDLSIVESPLFIVSS